MFHFLTCSVHGLLIVCGGGPLALLALDFAQEDAGLRPAGSLSFWEIISSTIPPWFQEALRDHGFGPHQSDGHVGMSQASG